jgi:tetratricopeptide (TPR) repeat protein
MRDFYCREGPLAWSKHNVPHHITSCPFTADAYARTAFAYLRDCLAAEHGGGPALDPARPIHIVELGAGPGRFGYLFVRRLLELHRESGLDLPPIRHVLTDISERNVEAWLANPWLEPLFDDGVLDAARFDLQSDRGIELRRSGERLAPGTLANPLIVIANYVFDSVPQDAFLVERGELYETLVTTTPDPDGRGAGLLGVRIDYHHQPARFPYYGEPHRDAILDLYRQRLPRATFGFPVAALACIDGLIELSGGRALILSGDKGMSRDDAFLTETMPLGLVAHAHRCFSMSVDYQILGEYCRRRGGFALHPSHPHRSLTISAFLFGSAPGGFSSTRGAYAEAIDRFGPDGFFTMAVGLSEQADGFSTEQLLAMLRFCAWDHQVLLRFLPTLKARVAIMSPEERQQLRHAVHAAWEGFLPISTTEDLAFHFGTFLMELGFDQDAVAFLRCSTGHFGLEAGNAYNLALCLWRVGEAEEAREWIERAVELDPQLDEAKALRIEIASAPPCRFGTAPRHDARQAPYRAGTGAGPMTE